MDRNSVNRSTSGSMGSRFHEIALPKRLARLVRQTDITRLRETLGRRARMDAEGMLTWMERSPEHADFLEALAVTVESLGAARGIPAEQRPHMDICLLAHMQEAEQRPHMDICLLTHMQESENPAGNADLAFQTGSSRKRLLDAYKGFGLAETAAFLRTVPPCVAVLAETGPDISAILPQWARAGFREVWLADLDWSNDVKGQPDIRVFSLSGGKYARKSASDTFGCDARDISRVTGLVMNGLTGEEAVRKAGLAGKAPDRTSQPDGP